MSTYGPPGGPYPGQPQDPWEAQSRREGADDACYLPENYASEQEWSAQAGGGYSQQPYRSGYDYPRSYTSGYDNGDNGGSDAGYADPSYADPRYGDQNYGDQSFGPGWESPLEAPERPSRRGRGPLIAAVVIVSLLVVGGVGSYLLYQDRQHDVANGPRSGVPVSTAPRVTQPASASPNAAPGAGAGTGSPAAPDGDAFTAKVGECLVNRGDEGHPEMKKVACGPNTYQVLKRIDGTADKARCNGTPNLTDWYFYDHPDNSRDFVLCLHKR
jgi:hypothetical protein